MSENQTEEVQNQDGTPELTADEIWAQAGATETEEVTPEPQTEEQETVEVEEPVAEGPEDESTGGYEVAEVEATPEEPKHDFEKRYKDLEKEFHRRNEEQTKLRDELMALQIQNLKLNQDLQKPKPEAKKEEPKVNPYALTDEEKKVAEEFPDILAVAQKMAMEEVNKMASKNVFLKISFIFPLLLRNYFYILALSLLFFLYFMYIYCTFNSLAIFCSFNVA